MSRGTSLAGGTEAPSPTHTPRPQPHNGLLALTVGATVVVVAVAVGAFNTRIGGFILDETLIKQSAVHYTSNLPFNLLHDLNARATSRLYPLLVSPLFNFLDGVAAVRSARALNALLFALTAVPVALLARSVVRQWWLAALAAVASVTVPWLTLTTAMFSESLAYLLVAWVMLFTYWAFMRPAWWRDFLVVGAIAGATAARTQLAGLFVGWLMLVALRVAWELRKNARPSVIRTLWSIPKDYPATCLLCIAAASAAMSLALSGSLGSTLLGFLGDYAATTSASQRLPSNVGGALALEFEAVAVGTGVIPAIFVLAWSPAALKGQDGRRALGLLVVAGVGMGALMLTSALAQGGYLGAASEERYFVYLAPILWVLAVSSVGRFAPSTRRLAGAGLLLAALALVVQLPRNLDVETSFFAPAISAINFLAAKLGVGGQDLAGVLVACLAAFSWAVVRSGGLRWARIALVFAWGIQLVLTAFLFLAIAGRISGVQGRIVTAEELQAAGFIDRKAEGREVTWLGSQVTSPDGSVDPAQRTALLYNDSITRRIAVPSAGVLPDNFPLNSLPVVEVAPNLSSRRPPVIAKDVPLVIQQSGSPFIQVTGKRIAHGLRWQRLDLIQTGGAARVRWLTRGLNPDGTLGPDSRVRLVAWNPGAVRIVVAASEASARIRFSIGGTSISANLAAGEEGSLRLFSCEGRIVGSVTTTAPASIRAIYTDPRRCVRDVRSR